MYLNKNKLLAIVIEAAILDRISLLDAYANVESLDTVDIESNISDIKSLNGLTYKEAYENKNNILFFAFIYAEQHYLGLYEAEIGREKSKALSLYNKIKNHRLVYFGKTSFEQQMEAMISRRIF